MPEKKKPSFLKSLRFRILIILVILGIVPSVIVAHVMVAAYENKAVILTEQDAKGISFAVNGAARIDVVKYDLFFPFPPVFQARTAV